MADAIRVRQGGRVSGRARPILALLIVAILFALGGHDVPIWGGCSANLGVCGNVIAIGIFQGMIIALIALGYTLVYGILHLINFANGDVFMMGSLLAFESLAIFKSLGLDISGASPLAYILIWFAITLPITMVIT